MAGEINWGVIDPTAPGKIYGAIQQGRDQYSKNKLQEIALQQAMQQADDEKAVRSAYQQAGGDANALQKLLMGQGLYKQSNEIAKQQLETQAKKATIGKDEATAEKSRLESAKNRIDMAGQVFGFVRQNPTLENAMSAIDHLATNGILNADQAEQYKAKVQSNPQAIGQLADSAYRSALSAKDQLSKFETRNTGGTTDTIAIDPVSGKTTVVSKVQNTMAPGESARLAQAERHFQQSQAMQQAAHAMGKIPPGYRQTADGNLEAIPGGPADAKAQAESQKIYSGKSDVDMAIGTLRDAYDRLEKGGGITSTNKGKFDNASAWLSSSSAGQGIGKIFGTDNQSARNDIAMTRPALVAALMKATGMSAKQMDSNAELKLWLATATDPTLDVESNRRALNKIEQKYLQGGALQGSNQNARQEPSKNPTGEVIKIQSDDEYSALPSGALFISPDGKTRRKP